MVEPEEPVRHMDANARVTVLWTADDSVQLTVDGPSAGDLAHRLERTLDLLIRTRGTRIGVDLSRMHGPDVDILELLAAVCHRLWAHQGCLHVTGLDRRLVTRPEVTAFPEIFGSVTTAA